MKIQGNEFSYIIQIRETAHEFEHVINYTEKRSGKSFIRDKGHHDLHDHDLFTQLHIIDTDVPPTQVFLHSPLLDKN